ncbi:PREDICTED: formin-like protein 6 [Priapulus caudatus]|uniref:Formin-like protein 6 n=1 Tax=Priapulus caudatus TaxID=37621 RepID=A0ABM1ET51_PRICU|nr:PREDICTED: formin-like protein 6 [Priapulus caudatus]
MEVPYVPISAVAEEAEPAETWEDIPRRIPTTTPLCQQVAGRRQMRVFGRGLGLGLGQGPSTPPPGASAMGRQCASAPVPVTITGSGRGCPRADAWSRSGLRKPPPPPVVMSDAVTQTTCEVCNCIHPVQALSPRRCPWHEPSCSTPSSRRCTPASTTPSSSARYTPASPTLPPSSRAYTPRSPPYPPPYGDGMASAAYPPPPPRYRPTNDGEDGYSNGGYNNGDYNNYDDEDDAGADRLRRPIYVIILPR